MLRRLDDRQKGLGLVIFGVILLVAAILADVTGWGSDGFGAGQVAGIVLGTAAILAGGYLYQKAVKTH